MEIKNRFWIGFISAFAVPLVKIYQNGVSVETLTLMTFLGAAIPIIAMAILVGCYAYFLEKGCQDVKQLFKICLALPGLIVTLAGGMATANASPSLIPEAKAQTTVLEETLVKCSSVSEIKKGFDAMIAALTGYKKTKFYVVDPSKQTDSYIVDNGIKYYVQVKLADDPKIGNIYNMDDCKLTKYQD